MVKFQERLLLILLSLTILFSFVLIGFGAFFSNNKEQIDAAVISGILLFGVSSTFVATWLKSKK